MKRMIVFLTMVVAAIVSVQAQYLSINKSDGEVIFYNSRHYFHPQIRDGKPVWQFYSPQSIKDDGTIVGYQVLFSVEDVDDIVVHHENEEAEGQRQALMELYQQMDGDNWTNHENWGTERPINEWYGNQYNETYVQHLYLYNNNLQGEFPSSLKKMPYLYTLYLHENKISGELPDFLANMYNLKTIELGSNQLSGNIPEKLAELPELINFNLAYNNYSGPLPENTILKLLDR